MRETCRSMTSHNQWLLYFDVASHRLSLLDDFDVLLVEVQQGEGVFSLQLRQRHLLLLAIAGHHFEPVRHVSLFEHALDLALAVVSWFQLVRALIWSLLELLLHVVLLVVVFINVAVSDWILRGLPGQSLGSWLYCSMLTGHLHIETLVIVDFHIHCRLFFVIFLLVQPILVLNPLQWLRWPLNPLFHLARPPRHLAGLTVAPHNSLLGECPLEVLNHL